MICIKRESPLTKKDMWLRECDTCGRQDWLTSYNSTGKKDAHTCRNCSNKVNGINRCGRVAHNKGTKKPIELTKRGSTYTDRQGYRSIYCGSKVYKRLHRVVCEHVHGLQSNQVVHHIDEDLENNHPDNLLPCSMQEHKQLHNQLQQLAGVLVRGGLITFNRLTNNYELAPYTREGIAEPCELRESLRLKETKIILSQALEVDINDIQL